MSSVTTILVGFAALFVRVVASHVHPDVLCTNSTVNLTHPVNGTACAGIPVPTSTSLPTIYTSPPNSSVSPPTMYLYSLAASVDRYDWRAHYSFVWIIDPDFNVVQCRASADAQHGSLSDVEVAHCRQDTSWLEVHNYTVPASFAFGWRKARNGTVLVLRSTNPASAHHCPDFPHDACWAQGLYWVPRGDIRRGKGGVQAYVGADDLYVVGTYCKSGMPECAWSEYLY